MAHDQPLADFDQAIAYLNSFIDYERLPVEKQLAKDAITLERVELLANLLGRPSDSLRCIHIAGSKGKGSTSAILSSILRSSGLRVGLFTSPHLVDVRERIQVDGEPIGPDDFSTHLDFMRPHLEAVRNQPFSRRATYFEILTHMAFLHFVAQKVDVAVLEVGMGGRLDSTNICTPVACAITHIELEHTRTLGDTCALIAAEKAGILKPGVPVAVGVDNDEALDVIETLALERGCPLFRLGPEFNVAPAGDGFTIRTWAGDYADLQLPHLIGKHQHRNAAVAIALAELAGAEGIGKAIDQNIRSGLATARLSGRLEPFELGGGPGILDGSHTVASVAAAFETIQDVYNDVPIVAIFATHDDKDAAGMLDRIGANCRGVILTETGSPRTVAPEELAAMIKDLPVRCEADAAAAVDAARQMAGPEGLVLVLGSLYLVGRVKSLP